MCGDLDKGYHTYLFGTRLIAALCILSCVGPGKGTMCSQTTCVVRLLYDTYAFNVPAPSSGGGNARSFFRDWVKRIY